MTSSAPRSAIEILAETAAVLSLGGACAFAVAQAGPLVAALAAGSLAAGAATLVLRRVGGADEAGGAGFAVVDFLAEEEGSVLLLDDLVSADDDELLLDDPLPRVSDDSRVVRLFGAGPISPRAQPATIAPGELVTRIEHWLGGAASGTGAASGGGVAGPAPPAGNVASDEARAALHAALADIRRSLRQA